MGLGFRTVCIPGAPLLVSVGCSVQHVVYKYDAQKKVPQARSKQLERGGEFKVSHNEQSNPYITPVSISVSMFFSI